MIGPLVLASHNFYSVRLLNPFRGILLIVRIDSGRALSVDGINWRLQIRTGLKSTPSGLVDPQYIINAYALYGIWSEKQGLTRLPLSPGVDPVAARKAAQDLLQTLGSKLPEMPFPLLDNIEHWLFDKKSLQPQVLTASICKLDDKPDTVDKQWLPSLANDSSLSIRITDNKQSGQLKRLSGFDAEKYLLNIFPMDFQNSIIGLWVERHADGSGEIVKQCVNGNNYYPKVQAASFPKELLAIDKFPAFQKQPLQDYIQWQTPFLLALQDIDDQTREQWEIDAFKQPMVVHDVYRTYPKIINKKLINAALVKAVLRKAAEN